MTLQSCDRNTHHVLVVCGVESSIGEIMVELKSGISQCQIEFKAEYLPATSRPSTTHSNLD